MLIKHTQRVLYDRLLWTWREPSGGLLVTLILAPLETQQALEPSQESCFSDKWMSQNAKGMATLWAPGSGSEMPFRWEHQAERKAMESNGDKWKALH